MSLAENTRAIIGDNQPPSPLTFVSAELAEFLAATPVIQTHEEAKRAKQIADQVKTALKEHDAERDSKVRPLNTRVKDINAEYKGIAAPVQRVLDELDARRAAFLRAEEARRLREAEEARRKADEAARLVAEAQAREREALENAAAGEIGVKAAEAIADTSALQSEAERAARAAKIADKDTVVRVNSGHGKSQGLRTVETLIVENPVHAVMSMGLTDKIRDALLSSARDFRRLNGDLPRGVTAIHERTL